ncbi:uridine kinase [Nakamurella sp. UYEF19]|uniref:uridine kinase n=1 Tax=Nakamurella sp. UYEF19 TaxID=1756392 RepID=UPI00339A350E
MSPRHQSAVVRPDFWDNFLVGGDLDSIVARIAAVEGTRGRPLVAIDGIGASGKSLFAAQIAARIQERPVVVLHVDNFFNPSAIRHARGRQSPDGFWLDAYNYDALTHWALRPVQETGAYCGGSLDHARDRTVRPPQCEAPERAVVLVEGTFLHRDELWRFWDYSVFLDVPFDVAAQRIADRDELNGTHSAESLPRYIGAQQLYFREARPRERASLVVDNADFNQPRVIETARSDTAR